jgi:hypothetical protein
MKTPILFILAFSIAFLGCKDDPKHEADRNIIKTDTMSDDSDSIAGNYGDSDENVTEKPTKPDILTGVFIRSDNESGTCECNCVDVNFMQPTELCLDKKSGLSIMAKFKRMPDGSLSIYYQQPKHEGGVINKKIPWDKFDKTKPIAVISYSENNAFDLDWIGFTMDGELAIDYAIYGKKNLEGNYRKL